MRSKKISLVIVPLLLTACSQEKPLVQDVYNNQYDCAKDWSNDLCEEQSSSTSSGYHGGYYASRYLGPQYYQGNRKVDYQGFNFSPNTNSSIGQPVVSQTVKTASKSSPIRGGFGRSGFSFGG